MIIKQMNQFIELAKKAPNVQALMKLVKFFDYVWQKNPVVNEFELWHEKKDFYNIISDKLAEYKAYPEEIHTILLDNLSGKNIASISKSANLPQKAVEDYQNKFLNSKSLIDCIDFSQTVGANVESIERKVLKTTNADAYVYFAQVSPKFNKHLFEMRIVELISKTKGNARLLAQRQRAYKIIKAIHCDKQNDKENEC